MDFFSLNLNTHRRAQVLKFLNSKSIEKKIKPCFTFLSKSAVKGKEDYKVYLNVTTSTRLAVGRGCVSCSAHPSSYPPLTQTPEEFRFSVSSKSEVRTDKEVEEATRAGRGTLLPPDPAPCPLSLQPSFSEGVRMG